MTNIPVRLSWVLVVCKSTTSSFTKNSSGSHYYQEQSTTPTFSIDANKTSKILSLQFIPLALLIGLVFVQRRMPNIPTNTSFIPAPTPVTAPIGAVTTETLLKHTPITSFRLYFAVAIIVCGVGTFIICFSRVVRIFKVVCNLPTQAFTSLRTAVVYTTRTVESLSLLILNPTAVTEKMLAHTIEVAQGAVEIAAYSAKIGALRILASDYGIYLTDSANNSYKTHSNGDLIIDINTTEFIINRVFELVAAQELNISTMDTSNVNNAYPFSGAYASMSNATNPAVKAYANTLKNRFAINLEKSLNASSKNSFIVKLLAHPSTPIVLRDSLVFTTSNTINNRVLRPGLAFVFNENHRLNPVQKLLHPIQNIIKNIQNKLHPSHNNMLNNLPTTVLNSFKTNVLFYLAPTEGRWRTCVTFLLNRIPSNFSEILTYIFMWLLTRHFTRPLVQYLLSKAISYDTAKIVKRIYSTEAGKTGLQMRESLRQKNSLLNSTKDSDK